MTRIWVIDDEGNTRTCNATGELVIAGDTIMQGYWRRPNETRKRLHLLPDTGEITFHTGDICRLDEEGYCYFIGRADDILKVRGKKVAPVEIERYLLTHPGIANAAILGQPDPMLGTAVIAFIEPKTGIQLSENEILAYTARGLAAHMRPARVQIEKMLPRSGNGKIDKRAIKMVEPA